MEPIEVVRYIYNNYRRDVWLGRAGYQLKSFGQIVGVNLTVPTLQRQLSDRRDISNNPELIRRLGVEGVQERLQRDFKLGDDLFDVPNDDALGLLIEERLGRSTPDAAAVVDRANRIPGKQLHPSETGALHGLAQALVTANQPIHSWRCQFQLGATYVVGHLESTEEIRTAYRGGVFLVRPRTVDNPYDADLASLARHFGVASARLFETAHSRGALIVLLHAEYVPPGQGRDSTVQQLLKGAPRRWKGPPVVLTVGQYSAGQDDSEVAQKVDDLESLLRGRMNVPIQKRWDYFLQQWKQYRMLQSDAPSGPMPGAAEQDVALPDDEDAGPSVDPHEGEEAGPVLKRAKWHYESVKAREVWPINIRLRAFIASNTNSHATFDPTAGLTALSGGVDYPDAIRSFVEDVRAYLDLLPATNNNARKRVLRQLSTAKYWMTQKGLDQLTKKDDGVAGITKTSVRKHVEALNPAVVQVPPDRDRGEVTTMFVAGLGVKAIVQDEWLKDAPFERAVSHYRVALRLYENRSERAALSAEFPFEPHWGKGRVYMVSEALRHFIRTIEGVPARQLASKRKVIEKVPNEPKRELSGCSPEQVLDFCFSVLFMGELNDQLNNPGGRALSNRYGAYELSVEMLQLMSLDGQIGEPHWALHPDLHRKFVRECGFALMNIGDLAGAIRCFDSLPRMLTDADRESKARLLELRASDALDLSLPHVERGEMKRARELVEQAESSYRALLEETSDQTEWSPRHAGLDRRIKGRQALLHYLAGDSDEAIRMLMDLNQDHLNPDEEHILVAALARRDRGDDKTVALSRCLTVMLRQASYGHQHEALGFQIALAHLLRSEGRKVPAEKVMDVVHTDILKWGCSERTFLSFMLEAGRLLVRQDRPMRAYAAYLRPCMLRAKRRGFHLILASARRYAEEALLAIRKLQDDPATNLGELQTAAADEDRKYQFLDSPPKNGSFATDPMNGYTLANASAVISKLNSRKIVDGYLKELSS